MAPKNEAPIFYFAYGSDMNSDQIVSRCDHSKFISVARLPDHKISFFGHSDRWDGGLESLLEQPGESIFGVVYEVSCNDVDYLDVFHAARLDGTGIYFQFPVDVIGENGTVYPAFTYKKSTLGDFKAPSKEYLDYIINSAASHALPCDYLDKLSKYETKNAGYPVPKKNSLTKALLASQSCSC
ncbi:gamma-glutamylcyclotransferase family protein [Azomonas macrocytogenes]|uniref:Gamma-glutamylcyclotransferase n=1 Tax=Azomonas macrocytogenes TaxID=69962 RepID=A0A839T5P6_AZOMA|nr:gamma-glutamylcyclotransferase family protein [Azomonas macrocytogenes]MBB3103624.1 hypothetical protein [Azomonas macrocytogenes]